MRSAAVPSPKETDDTVPGRVIIVMPSQPFPTETAATSYSRPSYSTRSGTSAMPLGMLPTISVTVAVEVSPSMMNANVPSSPAGASPSDGWMKKDAHASRITNNPMTALRAMVSPPDAP